MNPFTSVWFWLLILSIIAFIVAFVIFETSGETNTSSSTTNPWVWILIAVGFALWIIALIIFVVSMANYHKCREIALACGEISPKEEKVIECPKSGACGVKVECFQDTGCGKKKVDCPQQIVQPSAPPATPVLVQPPPTRVLVAEQPQTAQFTNSPLANFFTAPTSNFVGGESPRVVVSTPGPEGDQAFSAAGLRPMMELSPQSGEAVFSQI